mmetsp:Transcript_7888/g.32485  ORF Transcript_7888/g.32485 Transcript_7888/m.32485 type:complete len:216 (+) Transcript_7888:2326-2973(+)
MTRAGRIATGFFPGGAPVRDLCVTFWDPASTGSTGGSGRSSFGTGTSASTSSASSSSSSSTAGSSTRASSPPPPPYLPSVFSADLAGVGRFLRMPRSRPGVAASLGLCVNASPSPGSASPSIPPGIEPASWESPASASSTRPRVSGPTSKLTRSRALLAERAFPARASTLQTYTASPSPTLAHRAPRESNATARTAPQCAPYACDGTFERRSAGA